MGHPARIICLTEESVETLYLLGRQDLIVGVSEYVERPPEAKKLPVVTQFIRSDLDKIASLAPDLVIGFSDLQKDIARDLIGRGLNVLITNQRSLAEILDNILLLARIVGEEDKGQELLKQFRQKIETIKKATQSFPRRPRVYFEEWDHPRFSGSLWLSELIEVCGGENIFADRTGFLAREREVTDQDILRGKPDLILASWCGKKVRLDQIAGRPGYADLPAVKKGRIFELSPAVFLQPGPALFVDGLDQLLNLLKLAALDDGP